jgi:hypothetical protein
VYRKTHSRTSRSPTTSTKLRFACGSDYSLHGDSDLCVVFEDGNAFRTWLDEVISEANRQNLTDRAVR